MKTLDEVIKAFELSCGKKDCGQCPYDEDCLDHHVCECYERMNDALHYLRGYREVLPEYAQMKLDAVKNDPLTWDELKGMEGKPVWVEEKDMLSTWIIIWDVTENWMYPTGCDAYRHEEYGKTWQAYRKERS